MKVLSLLLLLVLLGGCQKEVSPTGSLKLTYTNNLSDSYTIVSYNLYSEGSYAARNALMSGTMGRTASYTYQVTLTDLNPGNYVVTASVNTSQSVRAVQVTAGQERAYNF